MEIVTVLVFGVTFLIVAGSYWALVVRQEDAESRALRQRLKVNRPTVLASVARAEERLSSVSALETVLSNSASVAGPLRALILRSGLETTVGTVLLGSAFFFLVGLATTLLLTRLFSVGLLVGLCAGVAPFLFLAAKARKRLAKFEDQFPEAIDLIARSLRAGHALTTSLQMVGEEIQDPVGGEFRLLFDRQNFGMSLTEALKEFAARMPLLDARFFVTAVLIQRETGGNLSQVLDNLSSVIRERFKVKREIRTKSAHGRITGWALGLLPPLIGVALLLSSPEHILTLFKDPLGQQMLIAAIVLQVVGLLIIRKIVDVEY